MESRKSITEASSRTIHDKFIIIDTRRPVDIFSQVQLTSSGVRAVKGSRWARIGCVWFHQLIAARPASHR